MKKLISSIVLVFGFLISAIPAFAAYNGQAGVSVLNVNGTPDGICTFEAGGSGIISGTAHENSWNPSNGDVCVFSTQIPMFEGQPDVPPYWIFVSAANSYYNVSSSDVTFVVTPAYKMQTSDAVKAFQLVLAGFGALIGLVVLISGTKWGFKLIKKAFPNSY